MSMEDNFNAFIFAKGSETRVEKNVKLHICQTHVRKTSKARYEHVGYAWCRPGARR